MTSVSDEQILAYLAEWHKSHRSDAMGLTFDGLRWQWRFRVPEVPEKVYIELNLPANHPLYEMYWSDPFEVAKRMNDQARRELARFLTGQGYARDKAKELAEAATVGTFQVL